MRNSDNLYTLIKSMGKAEKRYFKIFATQQGGAKQNYLKLFDAIDKQEDYCEQALLQKFSDENFSKHFSATKKYLYDTILKSEKLFFADYCISVKLPDELKNMRVLLNKGMFDQALKQYHRIEQVYVVNEQFGGLFDILTFGEQLFRSCYVNGEAMKKIREVHQQKQMCLQYLSNVNEYIFLKNEIEYIFWEVFPSRSEEATEKLLAYLDNPLLKMGNKTLSLRAEMAYYECLSLIHFGTFDLKKLQETTEKALKTVENTQMNQYFVLDWQTTMYHRLCMASLFLGETQFEENRAAFEVYLDKFKMQVNLLDSFNGQLKYFNLMINYYFFKGQFNTLFDYLDDIKAFLEDNWNYLNADMRGDIALKVAQAYAHKGKEDKAMTWIEKITRSERAYPLLMQVGWAKQLEALLCLEEKNYTLLQSISRSTQRTLTKNEQLFSTEKTLLKYLNRIARNQGIERKHDLKKLRQELGKVLQDKHEKRSLFGLNILLWMKRYEAEGVEMPNLG